MEQSILVVDDDRDLREAIARCLNRNGFQAFEAGDGESAIGLARENRVGLVLSDLRMPGKDGLELLNELADRPPGAESAPPPFVMMTGHTDLTAPSAYALGVSALLSKPFRPPDLFEAVERALMPPERRWALTPVFETPVKRMLFRWTTLSAALRSGLFSVGTGGFFAAVDRTPPPPGTNIEFEFDFVDAPSSSFRGVGVIRWSRKNRERAGPRGLGVELVHLSAESRKKFTGLNRILKSRAYIPAR